MKISFPAMRAKMGGREYYATTMALSEIPRFFKFNDWTEVTPELRAQRVLNESRVPAIAKYISDNEDEYLFSSITCSYAHDLDFKSLSEENPDIGVISLDLENMEFVINDGQHRCAAIAHAIKTNPTIGHDKISVLLFPMENMQRMQQMFSDLNRYAQRSPKSLNILYDQRDPLGLLTINLIEEVPAFKNHVDMEKVSLPVRSPLVFTLTSIYDANKEMLGKITAEVGSDEFNKIESKAISYWKEVYKNMTDWKNIVNGKAEPQMIRQSRISTHSIVLRALGSVGYYLLNNYPEIWQEKLKGLNNIDWRKSVKAKVNPTWNGVCITAGSVVSNKQARQATFNVLANELNIETSKQSAKSAKSKAKATMKTTSVDKVA